MKRTGVRRKITMIEFLLICSLWACAFNEEININDFDIQFYSVHLL